MRDFFARFSGRLRRCLAPGGRRHTGPPGYAVYTYPYSCEYVGGPTVYSTGDRPPRGEDSPLVRPYLLAHERRLARRRTLRVVARGAGLRHLLPHGVEAAA